MAAKSTLLNFSAAWRKTGSWPSSATQAAGSRRWCGRPASVALPRLLIGATSQWRICVMPPGNTPLNNLADTLAEQKVLSGDTQSIQEKQGAPLGTFGRYEARKQRLRRRREPASGGRPVRGTVRFGRNAKKKTKAQRRSCLWLLCWKLPMVHRARLRGAHYALRLHRRSHPVYGTPRSTQSQSVPDPAA